MCRLPSLFRPTIRIAQNALQVIADAGWIDAMPLTRFTLEKPEALPIVLSYWRRWVADRRFTITHLSVTPPKIKPCLEQGRKARAGRRLRPWYQPPDTTCAITAM